MSIVKKAILAPILIVEDEDDHARLINRSLTESGNLANDLIHVENGEEAINFLRKKEKYRDDPSALPILILLDVKMPMMNGFEVLEELKKDEKLSMIPIVMLTTTSNSEDINKALSLGANDYIIKPVRFSDFTEKVKKLGVYWGIVSDAKEIFQ